MDKAPIPNNREFRGKAYVTARGKKIMSKGFGGSGLCSDSYAIAYERNMLARNPKAKLPGKIRRARRIGKKHNQIPD